MKKWPFITATSLAAVGCVYLYGLQGDDKVPYVKSIAPISFPEINESRPHAPSRQESQKKREKTRSKDRKTPLVKKKVDPYKLNMEPVQEQVKEEEEKPWYNLSEKERGFFIKGSNPDNCEKRSLRMGFYYQAALQEYDFRVAASYIPDLLKIMESKKETYPEGYQELEDDMIHGIAVEYDKYISGVIENCSDYSFDSVFRKVTWANIFFTENQDSFVQGRYVKELSLDELVEKGMIALEEIEYCIN